MIYILIPTTKERRPRLAELIESINENTQDVEYCLMIYENSEGWVSALRKMLKAIEGYCVILADDLIVTPGWLSNLWKGFREAFPSGDGVAEPYSELNVQKLSQHPLGHSHTILEYLHPGYYHCYSDNEFTDRAIADKKLVFINDAIVEHRHWTNGKAERDETYLSQLSKLEHDRKLYESRKERNFRN